MSTSCTDINHPYYEQLNKLDSEKILKFFLEDNAKRMKFVSLGEALDFVSWGFINGVAYDMSTPQMIKFVKKWMSAQKPRIKLLKIPLGEHSYTIKENVSKRRYGYLWNKFHQDFPEELPRINIKHDCCPRDKKHKGIIIDREGKVRCASIAYEEVKPSFTGAYPFFDNPSRLERIYFSEFPPEEPYDDEGTDEPDTESHEEYLRNQGIYEREEAVMITNPCYAIISEHETKYLPLQTILDRLNVFHEQESYANPFSGFRLANFIKAWWMQPGPKRISDRKGERNYYKAFPEFQAISSDD